MFKCHRKQPLQFVISHSGLWFSAVQNVCHHVYSLLSTLEWYVCMCLCMYYTCVHILLHTMHVHVFLR